MTEIPTVVRFGPVRCVHAYNFRVRLDFCKRKCKLLGATGCPRAPTFEEVLRVEMEGEKVGRSVAGG